VLNPEIAISVRSATFNYDKEHYENIRKTNNDRIMKVEAEVNQH
jgi:hypothetical protein